MSSDRTGRIEQRRRHDATVRGRGQHEVRVDRSANSVLNLPGDPLKRANGLRCCLIALKEEQGPSLGDQVEERHRRTAAGVDECGIGDPVAGSKPSTMATQPAASLFPVIDIDGEGRATIANSKLRNRSQDAPTYGRDIDNRRDGLLSHSSHQRILGQEQSGAQMSSPQHAPCNRMPLGLIGVEQTRRGLISRRQRQLPAEIEGILDPHVHPLTTDRTMDVRGVAREEDRTAAIAIGLAPLDAERRRPNGIANAAERHPSTLTEQGLGLGGDLCFRLVLFCRVCRRQWHDHPISSLTRQGNGGNQPIVADPDVPFVMSQIPIKVQVREQEALQVGRSREPNPRLTANRAVRAIGADQEPRLDLRRAGWSL